MVQGRNAWEDRCECDHVACECYGLMLHKGLLELVSMYKTIIRKENVKSRVRAVQMDNLRGLLCIKRKRMDGVSNAQIREYGE